MDGKHRQEPALNMDTQLIANENFSQKPKK